MAMGPTAAVLREVDRLFGDGTVAGLGEAQLLDRFVRRRDEAAFEAIVARHGPMVLAVCRRALGDPHDVEDAFQATFLVLAARAGSIRDPERLGAWLYRVARRIARRAQVVAARRRDGERQAAGPDRAAEHDAGHDEVGPLLHDEVDRLPATYRAAIVACYLQGQTHEEAARRLNWPVGTVRGRLARARALLRERLVRRGVSLSAAALAVAGLETNARAALPARLLAATVAAALRTGTTAGVAATLARWTLGGMLMTKVTWIGAVGLAVLGLGTLAGWAAGFAGDDAKGTARDDRARRIERLTREADAQRDRLARIESELRHLRGWDDAPQPGVKKDKPAQIAREGQKVALPDYVVEPPDLLIVEVLEALPGRPITGERLVRPDGTIQLGFYGDLYVSGLTVKEIRDKIIQHLRKFLNDEALGLLVHDSENPEKLVPAPLQDNDRVFVDVAAYNSKVYYVEGDVGTPGRLPITGNETVLDAIHFAGGLESRADVDHIELIRPAPPGSSNKPQTFKVDFEAITQRGDATTNYQLMPGDRIYVHRRADAPPDPDPKTEERLSSLEQKMDAILGELKALREQPRPD